MHWHQRDPGRGQEVEKTTEKPTKLQTGMAVGLGSRQANSHCACMPGHFSCVQLFVTLWTIACQPPLSVGFSSQEYWSGLPRSPPGGLPDPGIQLTCFTSPALAGRFFTTSTTWEALVLSTVIWNLSDFNTQSLLSLAPNRETFVPI